MIVDVTGIGIHLTVLKHMSFTPKKSKFDNKKNIIRCLEGELYLDKVFDLVLSIVVVDVAGNSIHLAVLKPVPFNLEHPKNPSLTPRSTLYDA